MTHREIAAKMKENTGLGGDLGTSIDTTIKNVVADIVQQYRPAMEADKVNLQDVLHSPRGTKFSPWREVYQWLWNCQFPRWQMDYIWHSWKEKAVRKDDWIWFSQPGAIDTQKGMKVPPKKDNRLNILGFLTRDNQLESYTFSQSINSDVVVACHVLMIFAKELPIKQY